MPKRIQRRRTKGWRMPEGAVYVGRPTKWGNPFRPELSSYPPYTAENAVTDYRADLLGMPEVCEIVRTELRGKDLVCWCPLADENGNPVPCHADVLLEIANTGEVASSICSPAIRASTAAMKSELPRPHYECRGCTLRPDRVGFYEADSITCVTFRRSPDRCEEGWYCRTCVAELKQEQEYGWLTDLDLGPRLDGAISNSRGERQ